MALTSIASLAHTAADLKTRQWSVATMSTIAFTCAERGGEVGWPTADECAPEFARELLAHPVLALAKR